MVPQTGLNLILVAKNAYILSAKRERPDTDRLPEMKNARFDIPQFDLRVAEEKMEFSAAMRRPAQWELMPWDSVDEMSRNFGGLLPVPTALTEAEIMH